MNILVTGAAGYIGSVLIQKLVIDGNTVLALDNLDHGHREAIHGRATFLHADLCDSEKLNEIFEHNKIDAVMHLAALALVGESMLLPGRYFHNNLFSGINLLNTMVRFGVDKLIFSSSAAVYGNVEINPIPENYPPNPVNPYGETKLIFEKILRWYNLCNKINFISLRYFNAAGADGPYGEDHHPETHLIPNILKVALGQIDQVKVFGTDYPTHDGTCVRDYVHVSDIAAAHILALKHLKNNSSSKSLNLGNGDGHSVNEIIKAASKVCGQQIKSINCPKRQGDPPILVASSKLAKLELGWEPKLSNLETIIESAWKWQKSIRLAIPAAILVMPDFREAFLQQVLEMVTVSHKILD